MAFPGRSNLHKRPLSNTEEATLVDVIQRGVSIKDHAVHHGS
jgi:hypothetical protein